MWKIMNKKYFIGNTQSVRVTWGPRSERRGGVFQHPYWVGVKLEEVTSAEVLPPFGTSRWRRIWCHLKETS